MTRVVYRFRDHTIGPDLRPEAGPIMAAMQCKTCGETSGRTDETEDGTAWAVDHLRGNSGHLEYREHISRPYHFEPGAWQ